MTDALPAWRDTQTTRAIEAFVAAATKERDPGYIPPAERIAVFDNDGTLWTEKPIPVQLDFTLHRMAERPRPIRASPSASRTRPPSTGTTTGWARRWSSTTSGDDSRHAGCSSGAVSKASAGMEVEAYAAEVRDWFATPPTRRCSGPT